MNIYIYNFVERENEEREGKTGRKSWELEESLPLTPSSRPLCPPPRRPFSRKTPTTIAGDHLPGETVRRRPRYLGGISKARIISPLAFPPAIGQAGGHRFAGGNLQSEDF